MGPIGHCWLVFHLWEIPMIEFLYFTFQSAWHFFGVLLLIWATAHGIALVVSALKGDLYE